jgi:hypothetical protein
MNNTLESNDGLGLNYTQGSGIDWNAVINQSIALGSHAISAFSGQNTGTQIGYNPTQGGVFAITPSTGYGPNYSYPNQQYPAGYNPNNPSQNIGSSVGGSLGQGLDGIFNWMASNPLLVAGGALGLFLLFREPPRRR